MLGLTNIERQHDGFELYPHIRMVQERGIIINCNKTNSSTKARDNHTFDDNTNYNGLQSICRCSIVENQRHRNIFRIENNDV